MIANWHAFNLRVGFSVALCWLALTACTRQPEHAGTEVQATVYTCPMHPEVRQSNPGRCPKCGMALEPVKQLPAAHPHTGHQPMDVAAAPSDTGLPDPNLIYVPSAVVRPVAAPDGWIQTDGIIALDQRLQTVVSARVAGRIERMYLRYAGQAVDKGSPIADIYSPQLLTAQREHLLALQGQGSLAAHTRRNLQLLGLSQAQIQHLEQTGQTKKRITIYSPVSGYVTVPEGPAVGASPSMPPALPAGNTSGGMSASDGMGGSGMPSATAGTPPPQASPTGGNLLREGMYVTAGQPMVRLAQYDKVWALIYLRTGGRIPLGTPVWAVVPGLAPDTLRLKVDFVEPLFAGESQVQVLRADLPQGAQRLPVGTPLIAGIHIGGKGPVTLPQSAVVRLGERSAVFIQVRPGVFRPQAVVTGRRIGQQVEILSGLAPDAAVAAQAGYLVDSETLIRFSNS